MPNLSVSASKWGDNAAAGGDDVLVMHGVVRQMHGKIVLITGGSGGIGLVTARRLAAEGARIIIVGRNHERGNAAIALIRDSVAGGDVTFLAADLASQANVRRLAADVSARVPHLDVLINNAGAMFGRRVLSPDGIEMTFALNHLAYVLLTLLLLPVLHAAKSARIVNVASRAHESVRLKFDDLEGARSYCPWLAYKRSKLANLYFTYELARRLRCLADNRERAASRLRAHRYRRRRQFPAELAMAARQTGGDLTGRGCGNERFPRCRCVRRQRPRRILHQMSTEPLFSRVIRPRGSVASMGREPSARRPAGNCRQPRVILNLRRWERRGD